MQGAGPVRHDDIAREIRRLLDARAPADSICPSDVARSLVAHESQWRALMPRIRDVARQMAGDGRLVITQQDAVLDPDAPFRGPVRLRRGPRFQGPER